MRSISRLMNSMAASVSPCESAFGALVSWSISASTRARSSGSRRPVAPGTPPLPSLPPPVSIRGLPPPRVRRRVPRRATRGRPPVRLAGASPGPGICGRTPGLTTSSSTRWASGNSQQLGVAHQQHERLELVPLGGVATAVAGGGRAGAAPRGARRGDGRGGRGWHAGYLAQAGHAAAWRQPADVELRGRSGCEPGQHSAAAFSRAFTRSGMCRRLPGRGHR